MYPLKIAFICGSLEKGRDGVGDYCRRLAGSLAIQGNQLLLIALSDRYVDSQKELVDREAGNIRLVRIPVQLPAPEKMRICRQEIKSYDPDWISLQFVIFSFHPKGLPFGFDKTLREIVAGRKLHIMFHELWVGTNGAAKFRDYILGAIQRRLIKKMLYRSQPQLVTTSIPIYKERLRGFEIHLLPLFGNIPVAGAASLTELDAGTFRIVHFGSFSSDLEGFQEQIRYSLRYAGRQNKVLHFEIIGNGGPYKSEAIKIAKSLMPADAITDHGLLPQSEVSRILLTCHWGISRADSLMYGKSGSTLSFLEHGLPVLLRGKRPGCQDQRTSYGFQDKLIFVDDDPESLPVKGIPEERVHRVARMFRELLETII